MKVTSKLLECVHPDRTTCLLTGRSVKMVWELFKSLDIHAQGELNDIIFYHFMKHSTDLNRGQIYKIFDMLDFDGSGQIDFNEFYVIICILVAVKDSLEKQFIYCHSRTVFDFLNADGSSAVSVEEFANFGFLFNFRDDAIKDIFKEFDLSGDKELDYKEFKMFAMACIDRQNEIDRVAKEKAAKLKHDAVTLEKKRLLLQMQKDGTLRSLIEEVEEKMGQKLAIPSCLQINPNAFTDLSPIQALNMCLRAQAHDPVVKRAPYPAVLKWVPCTYVKPELVYFGITFTGFSSPFDD